MPNRTITKKELLLAIAMSGYYQTTHVHYIPAGTDYTGMLLKMRSAKMVEPLGESFYKLTRKGWNYLRRQDLERAQAADTEIDKFISNL